MTFSLLARDPVTGNLGVASQSHYLGVGSVVTWAEAGVGVIATQAFADRGYGYQGLALMRAGASAAEALSTLVDRDPHADIRQVAFLDAAGELGLHSGERCFGAWAVARSAHAVALGNMLDNEDVPAAMVQAFDAAAASSGGSLAHSLVAGLQAAERSGGDIRGRQSAALLVVTADRGEPWAGVLRDLRVDDHRDPVAELARLVALNDTYDLVSPVVFDPEGPMLTPEPPSEASVLTAVQMLADADGRLGDNPEAAFWCAVLHARTDRAEQAREWLESALQRNPRLVRFLRAVTDAGVLTAEQAAAVMGIEPADPTPAT